MILSYILNDLFSLFGATFNYLFIIYIAQIYEIFSCSILFTFKFKKRKFFIVRLIIYIICLITLAFSLGALRSLNNATYLRIIYTLLLYIINMVLLTLLYHEPILTFCTAFIRILATRETVDVLFTLVLVLCGMDNRQSIDIISNFPYLNAFIYDTEGALQMREVFLQDQRDCKQIFLRTWSARPWYHKVAESIVRLLSPLL